MRTIDEVKIKGKKLSTLLKQSAAGKIIDLSGCDLSFVEFPRSANLRSADLSFANLRSANLSSADLRSANLRYADLRYANLSSADLRYADLSSADLRSADLSSAKNISDLMMAITSITPDAGEFCAWKKVVTENENILAKLLIPADAKRSNSTGRKCRASSAIVLGFETLDGKALPKKTVAWSQHDHSFKYRVGDVLTPDSWDENRWEECSHGIHFFITREEARDY